jgi:enamine deaminase RidA (YjgF/YER057c/UK114 family)
MPRFKLHTPGAWGEKMALEDSYSQVLEIDGRVELSGQGGWHPDTLDFPSGVSIETEIAQAFALSAIRDSTRGSAIENFSPCT